MNKAYPPLNVPSYPAYGSPVSTGDNTLIDLQALLKAGQRRFWLMLTAFVLTVSVVSILTFRMTPIYTATTRVIVDERNTDATETFRERIGTSATAIETEVQVIKSRALLRRVAERLNLTDIAEFNPSLRADANDGPGLIGGMVNAVQGLVSGGDEDAEQRPETPEERVERQLRTAADILGSKITVSRLGATLLIDISVNSESPQLAAAIANTIAEEYQVDQLNAKFEATERTVGWLSEKLEDLRVDATEAERAVAVYIRDNQIQTTDGQTLDEQSITRINDELAIARADLAERQARLQNVRNIVSVGGSLDGVADVINSETIRDLRRQEAEVSRRRDELATRLGPRHPERLRVESELESINTQIRAEVDRIIQGLEGEVRVSQGRINSLQGSRSELTQQLNRNNEASVVLRDLERKAESANQTYQEFLDRFNEASSTEQNATADARVLSEATAPHSPSAPRTKLNIFLGMILGGMLAGGLALLAELLDNYFSTPEDIERMFGLPSIGSIPMLTRLKGFGKKDMTPADYLISNPLSAFAESIRNLRASIIFADLDRESKTVAITSSLPDEGKTTITYCLGRMSAMSGAKTIIIDGDFRRRQLTEALGFEPERGFIEHLFGEVTLEDATVVDEQTGLHILPLTNARNTPRDVFGSRAFDALINELKKTYDLVVIDTGPILLMSESRVVASKADQVIVVAKWRSTSRWTLQETINILKEFNASIAGVAMTFVDLAKRRRFGYSNASYKAYDKYYSTD
ncbi:MAG: Wzz/FepE/Etk N-terminal domain-containing protein [Pseudomonadota bacterium]